MQSFILKSVVTAIVVCVSATPTLAQTPNHDQPSNQTQGSTQSALEDGIALQIGRYQIAIAKQNSLLQDMQAKIAELTKKCGDRCSEHPKGVQTTPIAPPPIENSTKDQERHPDATQTRKE